MAKRARTRFICTNCGHEEAKWLGRCPSCGEWNTLEERAVSAEAVSPRAQRSSGKPTQSSAAPISSLSPAKATRTTTGVGELDRVLGGGVVKGSTVLVGGEPGIGKSTLMLQMGARVRGARCLYVTGEESAEQVRMRAERLGLGETDLRILAESSLEAIAATVSSGADGQKYDLVIVDSIQTIYSAEAGPVPGTPNQIKLTTFEISERARAEGFSAFFVAHVTKEGNIAGPKTIEHMVDTVLYFEQNHDDTRFLRSTKNRFGSTDEVGLFRMEQKGLIPIEDPNSLFLVQRSGDLPAGVVVAPVIEGTRVLLVEIQALTVPAKGGVSRVFSDGIDSRLVNRMAAVLEKHAGLALSDQDLYVNVAGGMRIQDVAVELPLALALYSARTGKPFPAAAVTAGEVSLAGEVRPVSQMARRSRTSAELGFGTCIGPSTARRSEGQDAPTWRGVQKLTEAVTLAFG